MEEREVPECPNDKTKTMPCGHMGLHRKKRAFGDDSGVHDTGDCDQSTPWGCPYGGELA